MIGGRPFQPQAAQPPNELQTMIDGFFEPVSGTGKPKTDQHRFGHPSSASAMTSQYFPDDAAFSNMDEQKLVAPREFHSVNSGVAPHGSTLQAVPTSPGSFLSAPRDYESTSKPHSPMQSALHNDRIFETLQVAQIVPTMQGSAGERPQLDSTTAGVSLNSNRKRSGKRIGAAMTGQRGTLMKTDPSHVYAGGVRLRSIHFCHSITDIMDTTTVMSDREGAASSVALVEVIGTLASRVLYRNYCWEFLLRDPTAQDFFRKHPAVQFPFSSTSNTSLTASDLLPPLQCRMYDASEGGFSINKDDLEKEKVVRVVGIPSRSQHQVQLEKQPSGFGQDSDGYQIQCVSIRSAFVNEIRMAIQGAYRGMLKGPPHPQA
ncbi:hypothetical protein BGZ99_000319 [Dissophora globulifera]|uniref:Uncharacterized protein n=1 Tax=Dissophora globulifera TaxID=979702 RepID=A0A9P6RTS6_9FUNG|nr:hypothetical protein BGZ99_000319 [Dissophora globulifera]